MALWPMASSLNPSSSRRGLPCMRSFIIIIILTMNSQSWSFCSRVLAFSGRLPMSSPSLTMQCSRVQAMAFSNSSGSYMPSVMRRIISVRSTLSLRMPRYSWKKSGLTMEPAMPMHAEPIDRYDLPRIVATACAARAKRNIFSATSAGMESSSRSCTSCP